jgi:hypothetical protein
MAWPTSPPSLNHRLPCSKFCHASQVVRYSHLNRQH